MTETILVNSRISRTSVYHTQMCKHVDDIRMQHDKAKLTKGYRTDLTKEQAEQWGLRECKRCKAERTGKKYTEVTV